MFSRNDITGATRVTGLNFVLEGEQNAKMLEAQLNTMKQHTFFSPYLIVKVTPDAAENQLVAPNGIVTNFIVVACIITQK